MAKKKLSKTEQAAVHIVRWAYDNGKGWKGTYYMTDDLLEKMAYLRDVLRDDGIKPFPANVKDRSYEGPG